MKTHTTGPWHVVTDDGSIGSVRAGNGIDVAQAQQTRSIREDIEQEERKANTHLIAAAPELYECLRQILYDIPTHRDWLDPCLEQMAKDAIAKAKGAV